MTDSTISVVHGARPRGDGWVLRLVLGAILAVLGVLLLANPSAAARTLALLIGLSLVAHGFDALLVVPRRTIDLVAGAASILAGVVAVAWPGVTLWVVAVIAGMTCIAVGSLRITTGVLAKGEPGWAWAVAAGVVSMLAGLLALSWPAATALVLALLLGVRTLALGLAEVLLAFDARRSAAAV